MHDNGADIRDIQVILGHVKIETTQIYTQVSIRRLKEVHDATHPAERKRKSDDGSDEPGSDESGSDESGSDESGSGNDVA